MKVLFITRKYPPQVGGMENYSYGLINNYPGEKYTVIYKGSQKWLPLVYVYLLFKGLMISLIKDIDIVHLGDGVMTPIGWLIKLLTRKKVVFTAHGKDINFNFSLYQMIMPFFFKRMDKVYCVSRNTLNECLKVGINKEKCLFIPNGINPEEFENNQNKVDLKEKVEEKYKFELGDNKILLTVGRLSKRKGVLWFLENVMPHLGEDVIYIIIGSDSTEINNMKSWMGIEKVNYSARLLEAIEKLNLKGRVFWLGEVPSIDLKSFLNISDIFVMPNIKVEGDVEGFGIVALEAAVAGLPVIASNIEGIKDAIIDNENGILITSENSDGFREKIFELLFNDTYRQELGMKFSQYTKENYNWKKIASKYMLEFKNVLQPSS